ncbi:MAG: type III secretion HpaP family protein [Verrucomicrobiota bacterium]
MDKIPQSPHPDPQGRVNRVERAPDQRDQDQLEDQSRRFSDKLDGEKPLARPEKQQVEAKPIEGKSAGDAILSQLFGEAKTSEVAQSGTIPNAAITGSDPAQPSIQTAKVEGCSQVSPLQTISRVAEVIADRVLVSDSQFSDQKMISIKVKDDILPQTEIRISTEGGELKVELKTGSADSFNFLGNQKEGLVRHLQNALPDSEIAVSVEMDGSDSDQPGDGRSRNQRDLYEEAQAEEKDRK